MTKKLGVQLLVRLSGLYQQNIISREDKNSIANEIAAAMQPNANAKKLLYLLNNVPCNNEDEEYQIVEMIEMIEGEN